MKCCTNCFNDKNIIEIIERKGQIGKCDFCNSEVNKSIEVSIIADNFFPLFELYEPKHLSEDFPQYHFTFKLKNIEYKKTLTELIQEDWNLFNSLALNKSIQSDLLFNIKEFLPSERLKNYWPDDYWVREIDRYYGFYSYDAWNNFTNYIKHCRRFFIEITNSDSYNPVEWLKYEVFLNYEYLIENGSTFFRSRKGSKKDENGQLAPFCELKDIGAPQLDKSRGGRAAPEGIVYLYLASCPDTAIAESKPSKGDYVSVANVMINKELKVIDLTHIQPIKSPFNYTHSSLSEAIQVTNALTGFARELAKPISSYGSNIDYIPTQFIVELIQSYDFDGIVFKSVMGPGNNIVLFDVNCIEIINATLYKIMDINFSTKIIK